MLTYGIPLKVVSEILGHSSITITGDVHGHVAPDVSREVVATLGRVLGRPMVAHMVAHMVVKAVLTGRGAAPGLPETAPDLQLHSVGLTGFEPATP
ncbi:MAG: Phage integrase [Modestobacter sp.]|nr:Phage integrase [Modestobacter sp.]